MTRFPLGQPPRSALRFGLCSVLVAVVGTSAVVLSGGCRRTEVTPAATPPAPAYRGPEAFKGTVGSMTRIPEEDIKPILVSCYWLVVGLDGTGSSDVPRPLRVRLANELGMRLMDLERSRTGRLSPQRLLDHPDTTVVEVMGLVPGGATRGDPFDLLATTVQSQTTSLDGGRLFMDVDLAVAGTILPYVKPYAKASGAMYLNPLEDDVSRQERLAKSRVATVLSGGEVSRDRLMRLVLNQADWNRCRLIADRINERFGKRVGHGDKDDTAVAKSDSLIELNVPRRWRGQSLRLLNLIMNCYVQRGLEFESTRATMLGELVEQDPGEFASRVALAWEALGPNAKPVISRYYDHPDLEVRFAALQAGAHMRDERTSEHLARLAKLGDPQTRRRAAATMVFLPDSLAATHSLRTLLDDPDRNVRIAAYKALSSTGNMDMISRTVFRDAGGKLKFVLDIVDAKQPLVFISQTKLPRVVVFNSYTGFKTPVVGRIWDSRLMIQAFDAEKPARVYYRAPGQTKGHTEPMLPFVFHLVKYMARQAKHDSNGLDLPYSHVVSALHQFHKAGHIDADMMIEASDFAQKIAEYRDLGVGAPRPETEGPQPAGQGEPEPSTGE